MNTTLLHRVISLPKFILKKIVDRAIYALTCPRKPYNPGEVSNIQGVKSRIKRGDVVLVCGNARISYVVKILTHSPWSHVVMYVGDRQDLLSEEEKEDYTAKFGAAALKHLVIDSDPIHRVHLRPLDEYAGLMVRVCRAEALLKEDLDIVISQALSQLGREYDIKHIIRLLFFFAFPWELLPETLRRTITDFTLSEDDRICSRVLSEAFHSVGYPIRPLRVLHDKGPIHSRTFTLAKGLRSRSKSSMKLFRGGRWLSAFNRMTDKKYAEIHLKGARHITPADYDLSRFFSVVKSEEDLKIRYRDAKVLCPLPE